MGKIKRDLPNPNKRFRIYNPTAHAKDPKAIGLINNSTDYELGTPSLDRKENIILVAANYSKRESIYVHLKWRPIGEGAVNLLIRFQIELEGGIYENEQLVSYRPKAQPTFRSGHILQYGFENSNLKLIISAPYRRMRLIFRGVVRNKLALDEEGKFLRALLVICPSSGIFDFLDEASGYLGNKLSSSAKVSHDRHEQCVQIKGECLFDNEPPQIIYTWGFYVRHFIKEPQLFNSFRVLAHFNRGQVVHMASTQDKSGKRFNFGYNSPKNDCTLPAINKPFKIDWDQISILPECFEFEITSYQLLMKCKATKRDKESGLYEVEVSNCSRILGWAHIFIDDMKDTKSDVAKFEEASNTYFVKLENDLLFRHLQEEKLFAKDKPMIVGLEDSRCTDCNLVGSKAASLAQLHRFSRLTSARYHVPMAFVLTPHAQSAIIERSIGGEFRRLLRELEKELVELAEINTKERSLGESLRDLLKSRGSLPEELLADLDKKLRINFGDDFETRKLFAVRSSCWGEDEDNMSAAGLADTILGVAGLAAMERAIVSCFASQFSSSNIEYRRQHGMRPHQPMAVIVQEMVDCDKAGVLFTCDPTTGNLNRMRINANYGLGESVVSGESEPDEIQVNVADTDDIFIEDMKIGGKQSILDPSSFRTVDGAGQNQYDTSKCCLSGQEIINLSRCGTSVAGFYECPRDLEWGIKGDLLYLFQSRPITGLDSITEFQYVHEADQPTRSQIELCTRANTGEVCSKPFTPFGITHFVRLWPLLINRIEFGVFKLPRKYAPECNETNLFNSFHLFLYMNGRSGYMNPRKPTNAQRNAAKANQLGLFGHEINHSEFDPIPGEQLERSTSSSQFIFQIYTLPFRRKHKKRILKEHLELTKMRQDLLSFNNGSDRLDIDAIYSKCNSILEKCPKVLGKHVLSLVISNEYNGKLLQRLSKYVDDPMQVYPLLSKFLGVPKVVGSGIPEHLMQITTAIDASIGAEKFTELDNNEAMKFIRETQPEIGEKWDKFMKQFGHRGYNEFELSSRPWRENQEAVLDMIRKNCRSIKSLSSRTKKNTTNKDIIRTLGLNLSFIDEMMIQYVDAPNSQKFVAAREMTKDLLVYYGDILREATRLLAQGLKEQLRIPDVDLFYYFYFDELEEIIREPQPILVFQAMRRRQLHRNAFRELWLYDDIIADYAFTPNHLKELKELDKKLVDAPKLTGTPACAGKVCAQVCIITSYKDLDQIEPQRILVTRSTDIAFSAVFPIISGIITEVGGLISHGAVVAREYGLPTIIGVTDATKILKNGEKVLLDADNGTVVRLDVESEA